jgi:hypothetical protein
MMRKPSGASGGLRDRGASAEARIRMSAASSPGRDHRCGWSAHERSGRCCPIRCPPRGMRPASARDGRARRPRRNAWPGTRSRIRVGHRSGTVSCLVRARTRIPSWARKHREREAGVQGRWKGGMPGRAFEWSAMSRDGRGSRAQCKYNACPSMNNASGSVYLRARTEGAHAFLKTCVCT